MPGRFDLIVVGAGAVGSAAAYHAAKSGRRVLLLEQFEIGHARGSSHGESRIIRHSYTSPDYASLAPPAFEQWRELERESGAHLLTMTGGVDLGPADHPGLLACRDALAAAGFGSIWLEPHQARAHLPQFALPGDWAALWQSGAGILNADRCVRALASQAVARGAKLLQKARVERIEPGARSTAVTFEIAGVTESAEARAVVLAAGPWAGRWLDDPGKARGVEVTHQQVVYYPVAEPASWQIGRCPIYIAHGQDGFYGFPVSERPGCIKVAIELDVPIANPDEPPREATRDALRRLNETVRASFRGVVPEPADVVTCRYTETANRDFIIDRHPSMPNVVIASPCSGHGFKFSILTGNLAQQMALTGDRAFESPLWRERFRLTPPPSPAAPLATAENG